MEQINFELDGEQYPLENPIDFLLNWALEASLDKFKSKDSLDKVSKVMKATCPSIPDRYFYAVDGVTLPLIDSYKVVDFVAKLLTAVIDRRIKAIEAIPQEERVKLGVDVDTKIKQFRQMTETISSQMSDAKLSLIMGGIQITPTNNGVKPPASEPRLNTLKQQVEALSREISLLENT